MTDTKREPLLSDKIRAEKAHQRACEMHGDPMGSGSDWMEYYKTHTGGSFDARTFYESARAKDAELIQRLVDGLQQIADEGHWTPDMHELLNAADAAGFKPSND